MNKKIKDIANTNNFFLIEKNKATFWGLDILSKEIILNKRLLNLQCKSRFPQNEVIEIFDDDTVKFFTAAYLNN
ncbi:hypothetical protein MYX07_00770 [Patescibacteria group bacterium AH-259-L07]|nr:hypothetical protein [Patescibacteria group bacterium AH-259-L07]